MRITHEIALLPVAYTPATRPGPGVNKTETRMYKKLAIATALLFALASPALAHGGGGGHGGHGGHGGWGHHDNDRGYDGNDRGYEDEGSWSCPRGFYYEDDECHQNDD